MPDHDPEVETLSAQVLDSPLMLNLLLQRLADQVGARVLLFVDQLEELFNQAPAGEGALRQSQFIRAVFGAADDAQVPVRVVFTMREEFLNRLSEGIDARDALRGVTLLRGPGPETLQQILELQAAVRGYGYDERLAESMAAEVLGEVCSLPLLQFACEQLWQDRDRSRKVLTRRAYEAMGGVAGALARHADGLLAGLDQADLDAAHVMLLRLVTPERTRRVLPREALLEGLEPAAAVVLERLTEGRLVSLKRSRGRSARVELVHELLVVNWARLRRWIEESHEDLVFLEEAGRAAELWAERGAAW